MEIKFKVWLKNVKQFAMNGGWSIDCLGRLRFLDKEENKKIVVFTGLKDAEGEEIYEGDIVEYTKPSPIGLRKVIAWKVYRWNIMQGKTWKVVGNIYEDKLVIDNSMAKE